jgi:hypothetical protein
MPPLVGCIVNSVEELESWVINSLPWMLEQGRLFDSKVYQEMQRTLKEEPPGMRHTVAIVPLDNRDDMDRVMTLFFDTRKARENRAIRIRVLFDNVNVLIGDFDECSGPRRE